MKHAFDLTAVPEFRRMRRPLGLQEALVEAERCLLCEDAPCSRECPAGTDPGRFIRQIKFRNLKGAARTIRDNNPFGATCAHICPTEKLCASKCTAKGLSHPIDIAGLQHFAVAYGREHGLESPPRPEGEGSRIAVLGAGPAGAACAAQLARLGHSVRVYEKESAPGGVPRWNIPDFRLPIEEIAADLEGVSALGVEFRCGEAIDSPENLRCVVDQHAAVVVATGLNQSAALPLFQGAPNVFDYITWLRRAKEDRESMRADVRGKRVAIIGGGSVAMDAAATAMALGARRVFVLSLEHLDELPADPEEIDLVRALHVAFCAGTMITGATRDASGAVAALKGVEIEWGEPGVFLPQNARALESTEFTLAVDHVVQAIGTIPLFAALFPDLPTWDKRCFAPVGGGNPWSQAGKFFAVGDVVNRGATVVRAVGEGKRVAAAVDAYLRQEGVR